jgi:hypothetical protein
MIYEVHNIPALTGDESLKTSNHWMILFLDVVPRDPLLPIRVLMIFFQELLAHLFVDSYTFEVFVSSVR